MTGAAGAAAFAPGVPVRIITRGPRRHWFGYNDKLQFDVSNRYVLCMEAGFEHRSPRPDDAVTLGMVDLERNDRWIELGRSSAWCWQQGCMLQWLPGPDRRIIFNDREDGRYVSRILTVPGGKPRTLTAPIYAVSPDARWAVAPDFRRLADTRPGYGYNGIPDPNRDVAAPGDAGIWRLDLQTGKSRLIISLADIAGIPSPRHDWTGAKHWFNHLLVSPGGRRFIFLHRWTGGAAGNRRVTRMFTADADGKALHVVEDSGLVSHFIWRDADHILAWSEHGGRRHFHLYRDRTDQVETTGAGIMTEDGHCSYLPGNRFILCDTYPDKERHQTVYLFDTRTGVRQDLGRFHLPPQYSGEWRCDTHPRFSRDGRLVSIDAPHGSEGRQLHLLDISRLVA